MVVQAHIDASYGVHGNGKSHTGCKVTIGKSGASYFRSAKQKIVTKSSTEAELVALSDSANVPIHIARFLRAQGYAVPSVILYQDNKSAMALIAKGYSTSDLTKHISLRYFWVTEKVQDGTVVLVYCPTLEMHSNSLTKPVQGKQFIKERAGMTGWM
jgi:replicative superfamily II helicase